jgi:hypothetical protein
MEILREPEDISTGFRITDEKMYFPYKHMLGTKDDELHAARLTLRSLVYSFHEGHNGETLTLYSGKKGICNQMGCCNNVDRRQRQNMEFCHVVDKDNMLCFLFTCPKCNPSSENSTICEHNERTTCEPGKDCLNFLPLSEPPLSDRHLKHEGKWITMCAGVQDEVSYLNPTHPDGFVRVMRTNIKVYMSSMKNKKKRKN